MGQISFLVSLGIVEISRFSKLSIHSKVVLLITFLQNYASTANIQKLMKFYNLGNENFETDCRTEKMDMYLIWSKQGHCDTKI